MDKAPDAFRTISEVADDLRVPQHVLRFWESRFTQIKPMKRAGGRRYYRPDDVDLLRGIHHLLYGEGYTIRGVQRILKDSGPKFVQSVWQVEAGAEEDAEAVENGAGESTGRRRGVFRVVPSLLGRGERAPDDAEQDEAEEEAAESDAAEQAAMSDDTLNKLRELLDDLTECRRLLDTAIAPDAAPEPKED